MSTWPRSTFVLVLIAPVLSAVLALLLFAPSMASAASAGPRTTNTVVSDSSTGSAAWTDPTAVDTNNGTYARADLGNGAGPPTESHYLKLTNFGFSIPVGARIDGIRVEVERQKLVNTESLKDKKVRIVKGGVIGSSDRADTVSEWPGVDTYKAYGSAIDKWGQSWTPADINSAGFGFAISAVGPASGDQTAVIDHIRVTVFYTLMQCADGQDNDGDGEIDYPADPDCADPTDNEEEAQPTVAPTNTSPPTISGSPRTGERLTATPGSWTDGPHAYTYQWQRCTGTTGACADITEGKADTYLVQDADIGFTLRVVVTARNAGGAGTPASSARTATVTVAGAPVNLVPPQISGASGGLRPGTALAATPGTWDSEAVFTYQWEVCFADFCNDIRGAVADRYVVQPSDVGGDIRVAVTARNTAGSGRAVSAKVGPVEPIAEAPPEPDLPPWPIEEACPYGEIPDDVPVQHGCEADDGP
jgi:hypothetical protein